MNFSTFLSTLAFYISKYDPQQMENSMKPIDSAGDQSIRSMNFDFIIVGAGTAGCVVANRLSENPEWKVLLIEAGGDESYITNVPILGSKFNGTEYAWNYTTTYQESVCQDTGGYCQFSTGHVMGGSSTIGDFLYMRGHPDDYNEWEEMGNPGWSFNDVLPYFLKSEDIRIKELMDSPYHATGGPLPISHSRYESAAVETTLEAAAALGETKMDYNGANQIAIFRTQIHAKGAQRWSTSRAFLDTIRNRKNLFVFKNTLVTKLILDSNTKTAKGVSCVTNGEQYDVHSSKEVILSAGAINTPKLLMLSGVGPRDHLEELGIPVIADLPVGQHLSDQYGLTYDIRAKNYEEIEMTDEQLTKEIENYAKRGQGILTAPPKTFLGVLIMFNSTDSLNRADTIHFGGYKLTALGDSENMLNAYEYILTPQSVGTVMLRSNNCMDPPLIDPNYFQAQLDVDNIIKQIELTILLLKQKPWENHYPMSVFPEICNFNGNVTEQFARCFMKYYSQVGQNLMCTAKMGPESDKSTVVNYMLQVHGVKQLRVVDASVIPKPMSGTPFATVVMIAEKGSDLIKRSYQ